MLEPIRFVIDMPALSQFPVVRATGVKVELAIIEGQPFSSIQGAWRYFRENDDASMPSGRYEKVDHNLSAVQIDGEKAHGLSYEKVAAIFKKTAKAIKAEKYTAEFQGNDLIITTKK